MSENNLNNQSSSSGPDISPLIDIIKNNKWVNDLIAPNFKIALKKRIEIKFNDNNFHENFGVISCRAYRNQPQVWDNEENKNLKIIDSTIKTNIDFWKYAVAAIHNESYLIESNSEYNDNIFGALEFIKTNDFETYRLIEKWVSHLVLVKSNVLRSASHPHFFGIIFLSPIRSLSDLSISLIHEFAHQELFLINLTDRLVNSSSDFNLVHAPFQKRDRPPIARLHSAHALFRMIKFCKLAKLSEEIKYSTLLNETIQTFQKNELTVFGERLVREIYSEM